MTKIPFRLKIKRLLDKFLPPGNRLRSKLAAGRLKYRMTDEAAYSRWMNRSERPQKFLSQTGDPLISVVVPTFNTKENYLVELVASLKAQTYPNWQLILADGSTEDEAANRCREIAASDSRIKYLRLGQNFGIAGNTNSGIKEAKGEFIAFLDHDDTLAPFALEEVVKALRGQPELDVFYSDEDKLTADGRGRLNPLFKPDWSRDLFLAVNYMAHFVVVRADLVREVGAIRPGYDGAQDYDFLLRVFDRTNRIHHVSRMSYHWRIIEGSTAKYPSEKNYTAASRLRALDDYLSRNSLEAKFVQDDDPALVNRIRYSSPAGSKLRVVVFEDKPIPAWLEHQIKAANIKLSQADSDFTLFINPELEAKDQGWLRELVGVALQPGRGLVGGLIQNLEGCVLEAGYCLQNGRPEALFEGMRLNQWTYTGMVSWPRNLVVPPINCCLIRTELIPKGLTDPAAIALKLHTQGLLNVFWPFAVLTAAPAALVRPSLKSDLSDPFLNPNLELSRGRPGLRL